ncbi:hypothetical protein V8E36_006404 [Tilletia maclaganii]
MPAHRKRAKDVQAHLGPEFDIVSKAPVQIACLACDPDRQQPFDPKRLQQHTGSNKHARNLDRWISSRLRADRSLTQESRDEHLADASALPFFSSGKDHLLPDDPSRLLGPEFANHVELEDDIAALTEEATALRSTDKEFQIQLSKDSVATHRADLHAFPFASRETFAALALQNSPRHVLSRDSLEIALCTAESLNARAVPSLRSCRDSLLGARQELALPVRQHTTSDKKIFYASSIESKLRQDFANPVTRDKMQLLPCHTTIVRELYEADELAFQTDTRRTPPFLVRQEDGLQLFTDEVVSLSSGDLIRPYTFFVIVNDETSTFGEAWPVLRRGNHLEAHVNAQPVVFDPVDVEAWGLPELQKLNVFDQNGNQLSKTNPLRQKARGRYVYQVPIILFEDETSGTTSKRWNENITIYFQNASLPRAELDKPASVRLLSVSTNVSANDLMEAVVEELCSHQSNPFVAYDCKIGGEVLVRPLLLFCVADNPMAAELAASIGMRGCFACRFCVAGGTRSELQTQEGMCRMLKTGEAKSSESIIDEIQTQLKIASGGVASHFKKQQTSSGVKDVVAMKDCEQMLRTAAATSEEDMQDRLSSVLAAERFCPLLKFSIHGFDICGGLPVDTLHSYLLGLVKYLQTQKFDIALRLEAAPLSGIDAASSLSGKWLVDNAGGVVGNDLKKIVQVAAVAFLPLRNNGSMTLERWMAWASMGIFGRLLMTEAFERDMVEKYIDDLKSALMLVYASVAVVLPKQLTAKPKFHLMLHIADQIRRFGPAKNFTAERFESFNRAIRDASVHSNRSAPSLDILQKLTDQEMIRHVLEGGSWTKEGETVFPEPALSSMLSPKVLALYGVLDDKPAFVSTKNAIITSSGDRVKQGDFATIVADQETGKVDVVRVNKIVRNSDGTFCVEVTLMIMETDLQGVEPAQLREDSQRMYPAQHLDRLVNVAHDCSHNNCTVENRGKRVRMERGTTSFYDAAIVQNTAGQQHYLLNPCLFRSAVMLQEIYPDLPPAPSAEEIAALVHGDDSPDPDDNNPETNSAVDRQMGTEDVDIWSMVDEAEDRPLDHAEIQAEEEGCLS